MMDRMSDVLELVPSLKAKGEAFVLATVVRTVAATAAKAGAKAIIRADGSISEGWIGGGCARGAVLKAAHDALADGQARLISVQPPDVLQEHGVAAGEEREGVRFAKNTCPSHGTMDIFIEPVLPRPQVVLCGSSPVALAIADLAPRLGFSVTASAPPAEQSAFTHVDRRIDDYALPVVEEGERYIVVSTQSRGDEKALMAALATDARYVAFVGSRLKAQTLKTALAARGVDGERLSLVRAPAGLDLGAIGPEEIALSIIAEIVAFRRGREPRSPRLLR
jgi:xanthine dehydrogenase accessory factor